MTSNHGKLLVAPANGDDDVCMCFSEKGKPKERNTNKVPPFEVWWHYFAQPSCPETSFQWFGVCDWRGRGGNNHCRFMTEMTIVGSWDTAKAKDRRKVHC